MRRLFLFTGGAQSRGWLRAGVCAALLAAGCARVRVPVDDKNAIRTTLFTTTANGQTTLTWTSRTDLYYTLLVSENAEGRDWKALPMCVNRRGTGGEMQYTLPEEPARKRHYKLIASPRAKP